MTQTEALKLSLEGAANYIDVLGGDSKKYRQLLVQQSNEQVEPVAYAASYLFKDDRNVQIFCLKSDAEDWVHGCNDGKVEPLYTHPPVPTAQPSDWSVFNTGAEVASGLTFAEAWDYLTPERLDRGWSAVCVVNKDNIPTAQLKPLTAEQIDLL